MGQMRNTKRILAGKPEGKRSLERQRQRWENNIKIGHREIGLDGVDWIHLSQDRGPVVGYCEYGNKPLGSVKGREYSY
jgi:hypothetical protein